MVNGVGDSDDENDVMPLLHHQNDGEDSSEKEDNDVDEEYPGPDMEQGWKTGKTPSADP